jgi:hypothetical protein
MTSLLHKSLRVTDQIGRKKEGRRKGKNQRQLLGLRLSSRENNSNLDRKDKARMRCWFMGLGGVEIEF